LRTYLDDASGMADGTIVRLNGITVGYLDKIRLTESRDPKRTVELNMLIQREFMDQIPVDSVATIAAANLLGDKFINITKGQDSRHVNPGDEIHSLAGQDIPELLAQTANIMGSLQKIIGRVDGLLAGVEAGKGNIGKLIKDEELYNRLNGIEAEAQQILKDVRTGGGTLGKLLYDDSLYQEFRSPLKRIDNILAGIENGQGSAGKFLKDPALVDDMQKTLAEIRSLVEYVNSGKGNLGKLLKDEQLHQHLDTLLGKLNSTVDRINAGQGTLGQFVVNPQMYETLTGATREFQGLAKDIRTNPKKFLSIRLVLF
jgi:phospholipid/cholesterol/gamma-HCH transport system substrate-binding protein